MKWLRYLIKCTIVACSILLLNACSSVPLGSALELARFNNQSVLQVSPEQLKARITISDPAQLREREVKLVLSYEFINGQPQQTRLKLLPTNQQSYPPEEGILFSTPARHRYDFVLAPESIETFKRLQQDFASSQTTPKNFRWTVYYYLKNPLPSGFAIDLDLAIQFSDNKPFLLILEGASIDID